MDIYSNSIEIEKKVKNSKEKKFAKQDELAYTLRLKSINGRYKRHSKHRNLNDK